ncbi:hypothetical protein PV11_07614 [Exophiala sideris]|uniref:Zn(2)-C6 fungal-type domain-containing protein n=1 Tax=Exophiala sideris TaxID=1016849 RepID=A0A0D1YAT2_9EURO|nr:hypothetical protein PV11_07614 [Exophiala sideris]
MGRKRTSDGLRSRNGCLQCRRRHRKCGEEQPSCQKCLQRHEACEYPRLEIQWCLPESIATWTKSTSPAVYTAPSIATSPREPATMPVNPSTTDDHESLDGLFTSLPTLRDEIFQDWTLEAMISPSAATAPHSTWSNVSDAGDASEDGEGESRAEEIRLSVFDPTHQSPMAITVALNTSEALAFTFYTEQISRILPAHDAPGNPYRRLTALAIQAPVLLHTVISVATAFMHNHGGLATSELSAMRQARALSSLREALDPALAGEGESHRVVTEAITFAILLQIFYLALTGGTEVEPHYASATYFLQMLGYLLRPPAGFLGRALVQRFAMIDVARAIYRRTRTLPETAFWLYRDGDDLDQIQPSFKAMTGCPYTILRFLVKITELALSSQERSESQQNMEKAIELEADMHMYRRSEPSAFDDALSEIFYWTAHLLLERRVYQESPWSRRVQFTRNKIFQLIESMTPGHGPDSSVFLPLNIAGREALTPNDRDWVRARARGLTQTYGIRTNEHCMELMEEIWDCVDAGWSDDTAFESSLLEIEAQSQCFVF